MVKTLLLVYLSLTEEVPYHLYLILSLFYTISAMGRCVGRAFQDTAIGVWIQILVMKDQQI
jgi:hypothetical protein